MSKFKIGDRVKIKPDTITTYTDHVDAQREGKTGQIFEKDYHVGWRVKWNDGRFSSFLTDAMLMPAEATPKQTVKVGDKLRVNGDCTVTGREYRGKIGEVIRIDHVTPDYQSCKVKFDDGKTQFVYFPRHATLIESPTIPDEITVNGEKYRRVVDDKPEERKKPEPKAGQVWKYNGYYILVTNNDRNVIIGTGQIGTMTHKWIQETSTFIADSLADALESGKITPADLRR